MAATSDLTPAALGVIDAIKAEIDPIKSEFTAEDMTEVGRLLAACLMAIDDDGFSPTDVRRRLSGLTNGYGCWLDTVESAILSAALPDENLRLLIFGAFKMAKSYLFDIQGHNAMLLKGTQIRCSD